MAPCCSSRSTSIERGRLCAAALCLAAAPLHAQTLSNSSALSFGSFTASGGGTITVNAGGGRSKTGSVVLSNQGAPASPAQFTVTGTNGATFTATLPANGTVLLSDGTHTMSVDIFTISPALQNTLSGGSLMIGIGATLTVNSAQAPGNYTGSFNLTVDYP